MGQWREATHTGVCQDAVISSNDSARGRFPFTTLVMHRQEGAGKQKLIFSALNYQGHIAFMLGFPAVVL